MKTAPAVAAGERFFTDEAERIARLCHAMSDRFARGGRLIAVGCSPQARSDARHVAVEFVHPVIVGKRALPALAVTHEPQQLALLAEPDDMVIAFDDSCRWATDDAKPVYLSIGYGGTGAEWEFDPGCDDPFVAQELIETHYHLLWAAGRAGPPRTAERRPGSTRCSASGPGIRRPSCATSPPRS
jgi:D-sedoheptulose 7-phosphate isomerase